MTARTQPALVATMMAESQDLRPGAQQAAQMWDLALKQAIAAVVQRAAHKQLSKTRFQHPVCAAAAVEGILTSAGCTIYATDVPGCTEFSWPGAKKHRRTSGYSLGHSEHNHPTAHATNEMPEEESSEDEQEGIQLNQESVASRGLAQGVLEPPCDGSNAKKECGGASICTHGRQRSQCKGGGGSSICTHGRIRRQCKDCGGSSICTQSRAFPTTSIIQASTAPRSHKRKADGPRPVFENRTIDPRTLGVVARRYTCYFCGLQKVATSTPSDGIVRIRCPCGGMRSDGVTRMHAKWSLEPDVAVLDLFEVTAGMNE